MPEDKDQKPAAKKAAPAKKAANAAVDSMNTNAELAVRAARPYKNEQVDRPATGRDHTAPGNEAEHPVYSDEEYKVGRASVPAENLSKPAVAGFPEVEIATRTSDRTQAEDTRFRKRYVVLREAYQPDTDAIHARNKIETLNDAINHGLHPRGEADFDGTEDHPDGVSLYLDYSVEVVPASTDDNAEQTATPLHVLHDKYDGSTESQAAEKAEGFNPEN